MIVLCLLNVKKLKHIDNKIDDSLPSDYLSEKFNFNCKYYGEYELINVTVEKNINLYYSF